MLDEDQQTAFDLAKDGHNLVVIGQGGCGKTFLIKQIVNYLRSKGKTLEIQNCRYDVKFVGFLVSEEHFREKCRPFKKRNITGDEACSPTQR
jgi:GTPase SAR1 family protein